MKKPELQPPSAGSAAPLTSVEAGPTCSGSHALSGFGAASDAGPSTAISDDYEHELRPSGSTESG